MQKKSDLSKKKKVDNSCCEKLWNFVHLNAVQLIGMFVLVFTLTKRRWFLYCMYLLAPIISFTYVKIMDDLTQVYLKPNLDETLERDSPFGTPHDVDMRTFTLAEIQSYLSMYESESMSNIPTNILYTYDFEENEDQFNVNEFFELYGTKYEIIFPNFNNTKRQGMELIEPHKSSETEIDDMMYESLKEEEDDETFPNQFLGSLTFIDFTSQRLCYTVEYEQSMERRTPSVTIQSSILALKNNYSTFSHFCSTVGVYGHTFECENFISSSLIHYVNSAYIFNQSGTIVKARVGQLPYDSLGFDFNFNRGDRRLMLFLPLIFVVVVTLFVHSIISDKVNGSRSLMTLMGLKLPNYLLAKYSNFFIYYLLYSLIGFLFGVVVMRSRVFTQVDFVLLWILIIGTGLCTISFGFFFSAFFRSMQTAIVPLYLIVFICCGFFGTMHIQVIPKGRFSLWKLLFPVFPFPIVDSFMQLFEPVAVLRIHIHLDHIWSDSDFAFAVFSMYLMAFVYFLLFLYFEKVVKQNFTVRKHPCFCLSSIVNCCCCCCYAFFRKDEKKVLEEEEEEDYKEDVVVPTSEKDDDVERIERQISNVKNPSEYGILVRNLMKRYSRNSKFAVDDISFRVPRCRLFGLLGENGAGKTTTIRILIGELSSTKGECYIDGKSSKSEITKIRNLVGVCHQHNVLWDELTVEEHLFLYARIRGIDVIKQMDHVTNILRDTELIDITSNPEIFKNYETIQKFTNIGEELEKNNLDETELRENSQETEETETSTKINKGWAGLQCFLTCCLIPCLRHCFKPCKPVRNLSGGQKRKLNLAISLIGNPSTIFLDEPTTGLDPKTKNQMWKIISELKKSKSIILTTHEMMEAEVLCDDIGIMKAGKFVAYGSSFHLKNKFGKGYKLKIIRNSDDVSSKERIFQFINSLTSSFHSYREKEPNDDDIFVFNNVKNENDDHIIIMKKRLVLDFGNTLIWELELTRNFKLSAFVEEIERRKDEIGIKDWSINQNSLNDVFVKLIGRGQHSTGNNNEEVEELLQLLQTEQSENIKLREYIRKNDHFRNNKDGDDVDEYDEINIIEEDSKSEDEESNNSSPKEISEEIVNIQDEDHDSIIPPVTDVPPRQANNSTGKDGLENNIMEASTVEEEEDSFSNHHSLMMEKNCYVIFFTQLYVLVKKEIVIAYRRPIWTALTLFFASIVVFQLWIVFMTGKVEDSKKYYDASPFTTLLGQKCLTWVDDGYCYHFIYTTNGHPKGNEIIDHFVKSTEEEFDHQISYRSFLNTSLLLSWSKSHPNQTYHAIIFEEQSETIVPPSPVPIPYLEYTVLHNSTSFDGPDNDLPLSMTGYIQQKIDQAILFVQTKKTTYQLEVKRRKSPRYPLSEKNNLYDVYQQIGPCFYAVAFTFVATQCSHVFLAMKEIEFHKHLIRSGVNRLALYCSYVVFFSILCVVNSVITYIVSILLEIDVVRRTNPFVVLSLFTLYSFSLISTLSITFPFLQNEKQAQSANSIFILLVFFTSFLFDSAVIYSIYESAGGMGYFVLYFFLPVFFSPINFCKIFADFSYKTLPLFDYQRQEYVSNVGFGFDDLLVENRFEELSLQTGPTVYWFLYLILNIFLYIGIGLVFYACVEHKFYEFEFLWKRCCFSKKSLQHRKENSLLSSSKKKKNEHCENDFSIYFENLSKSYIKVFPALQVHPVLRNITFSFPKNRLIGILGPNGAGKSTMVNLITGILKITDGEILFDNKFNSQKSEERRKRSLIGFFKNFFCEARRIRRKKESVLRVKKDMNSISKIMGIVPQHDILISRLQTKEMLELFGVCRGIKLSRLNKIVTSLLSQVQLSSSANELVKNLSGGMKRKLSIAMSLIGEPKVIILDEPTTGIDAYSCHQIWKLFYEIKKRRSVILTSHKMFETELLSDQIAILNNKKFQVYGEALELKKKFGDGYVIQLVLRKPGIEDGLEEKESLGKMNELVENVFNDFKNSTSSDDDGLSLKMPNLVQNSGNYNVSYSVSNTLLLSRILRKIEELKSAEENGRCFVESYGISQCTLNSVYMRITLD